MSNWKLTPRSKRGRATTRRSLQELSNYFSGKTKEGLEKEIGVDFMSSWDDFDYEKALFSSSVDKTKILKKAYEVWKDLTLKELAVKVGREKLKRIMIYVKNNYPGFYNNTILLRWPNVDNFI
tara:strand:- start:68 stop:436 length:369 start_codon:yes stop_codon:yes gene_type:complete